jgi:hypothetical protein
MKKLFIYGFCFAIVVSCSFSKKSSSTNQPAQTETKRSPAAPTAPQPAPAQPGELSVGQANGSYTAKGETVELKYAYAGRAQRFGTESLVILLTDKPIPPEAIAEEIKSTPLLEGNKIRGLEYAIDENGMWVRFHPSQYQESGSNKLKDYKVENDIVRGVDENDSSFSDAKYSRSVKFVASIIK